MSPILVSTLSGLVGLVFWGLSDWFLSRSSKQYSALQTNLAVSMPDFIVMAFILLFTHQSLPDSKTFWIIALVATIFTATYLVFIKALSLGTVGVVVPLSSMYPLVTLLLASIFLNVVFTGWQIAAMVTIISGAMLLAYEKNHTKIPHRLFYRQIMYTCLAVLLWGVAMFFVNTIVDKTSWQSLLGILTTIGFVQALLLVLIFDRGKNFANIKISFRNKPGLLAGLAMVVGSIAFYSGAEAAGSVLIIAVIVSAAPLVTSLLAAIIDKEKLGIVRRAGALIVVIGIVVLNIV